MKHVLALVPTRAQMDSARAALAGWTWLDWAALPVTDRRWTAPLAAAAVGMGLFIGVAMGPGIGRTVGAAQQVIQMPATERATDDPGAVAAADPAPVLGSPVANKPAPARATATAPLPAVTAPPLAAAPPAPAAPTTAAPASETTTDSETADETTPPAEADDELAFKGTVMHVNEAASSYVLTTAKGQMNAIHAKRLPAAGTKLEVPVRALVNGTYAEDGRERRAGTAKRVVLQGLVTFVDAANGDYTVSRKGASVLVHAAAETEAPPRVGTELTVHAALDAAPEPPLSPDGAPAPETPTAPTDTPPSTAPPEEPPPTGNCGVAPEPPGPAPTIVTEVSREVEIDFIGFSDIEGIVQGVCADAGELILSADDLREAGADVTLAVDPSAELDLGALEPGDLIDASAVIDSQTRALSLTGLSSDDGIAGADDAAQAQGDQAG